MSDFMDSYIEYILWEIRSMRLPTKIDHKFFHQNFATLVKTIFEIEVLLIFYYEDTGNEFRHEYF